ncbi:uncharacterized protein EV420DRAFT_1542024 [Desarmillaria tabescens]|uniref:Uncharacterized protein n=1 Tax=Armillaria tabescens TaxID=1929756 RepID=A0AA39KEG0_ARMTA|nr:uncharacterized protein EV420DRAFT_1542024 [Desarmillaria tabescens]KAK0458396.1 hypothetical protein EV420DRAFT_1542024 [Desarmillaria tabescens]
MYVHHCPAMNCAAYVQKTPQLQACTCLASLIEHIPTVNEHHSSTPLPYRVSVDNILPSNVNIFAGNMMTPMNMHPPSTNTNTSYSYGNAVTFTPTPQPFAQIGITQADGHSYSQVGNSYVAQYQNDNSSVNIQNSSAVFREDYPTASYSAVHGVEAWARQFE